MDRRRFIGWVGGAAVAFPLAASAKDPEKIAQIGLLSELSASQTSYFDDAFRPALHDLGYAPPRRRYSKNPPSTGNACPVVNDEALEQSQITACATSSGAPRRPWGCIARTLG
jgi:hypothetical protein